MLFILSACTEHRDKAELTVEHAARGAFAATISHDGRYSLVSSVDHGVSLWDNQVNGLKYQWQQSSDKENLVHSLTYLTP